MEALEFYEKEDPENNSDYNSGDINWYFSRDEMILFAERYAKSVLEEATEKMDKKRRLYDTLFKSEFTKGIRTGIDYAESIVESLIPK